MSYAANIYKVYLPILKPGHYIQIGTAYFVVAQAKVFPFPTGSLTGTGEKYDFKEDKKNDYQVLHGNPVQKRVVHIRYLALEETTDTYLYWLKEPFIGTKEVEIPVNSTYVKLSNPLEFNKWSYSQEMYASAKWASGATQGFVWEVALYIVEPTTIKPTKYLKITPTGDASFVEVG